MAKNAMVVNTDGEMSVMDISGDELATLQKVVGGWVQAIDITDSITMWANEEGKLVGLPVNGFATELWESRFGVGTDIIVGNIILTGGADDEGETLGLTDLQVEALTALFD